MQKQSNLRCIEPLVMLDTHEIERLISMSEALEVVEYSFRLEAEGKSIMPPKLYLDLPCYHGDFRAMPAYIDRIAGLKWVCVYPDNPKLSLPSVMALIILDDPNTGSPLCVMDGTYITNMRTGAAGGIAVKYLARKDSTVIGMTGAGQQAETQLLAINEVLLKIEEVKVFDQNRDASLRFVQKIRSKLNINIHTVKTLTEATKADIVVTTTPSRSPIVKKEYIRPGTHINAIGADAEAKQELEADILKMARIFVDDMAQASHSGEINVPMSNGLITAEDICGTLGEVIVHRKKGRESDDEITVFDSTGLAIQDIACAKFVYEKAQAKQGLTK